MIVREWLAASEPGPPSGLLAAVLAALGSDAEEGAERTAELCVAAAERTLKAILAERRFGRGAALDLLVVDALTTYAFEYASEAARSVQALDSLARASAARFARLAQTDV